MAKKKASRRSNGQRGLQNQTAASSSNTASASQQSPEAPYSPLTGPRRLSFPDEGVEPQRTSPPEATASGPDPDPDDGFQLVSRQRPIRRAVASGSQEYSSEGRYSSDRRLDSYMSFLIDRLRQGIDGVELDEAFAEIYRVLGPRYLASVDAMTEYDESSEVGTGEYSTSWDADVAPVRRESAPLEISIDNDEHFPSLGASRPPRNNHASGSGSYGNRLPWATVSRLDPPMAQPARPPRNLSSAVPFPPPPRPPMTTQLTKPSFQPPKPSPKIPNTSPMQLRKLAEEASVLLELYSKSAPDSNNAETTQFITSAFESISTINRHHRILASSKGRAAQKRAENDDLAVDAGCIICFSEVADTVLVPCHHLVLCAVSFRSVDGIELSLIIV